MTWEPTHVQFTVLRARNLVGKIKGKSSAKITDVFVSIALGKEKFQTSTIKYGNKMGNQAEWFEECDLFIPHMDMEVEVNVMNRGLLSDEFIGYATVPLHEFSVYDRPKSHWLQLHQKPSKLPDGRCRGELEVRLTFHVKSREETSPGAAGLKGKRAGSIKSLVNAVGDKLGKLTRSRSLRGEGNQNFSTPQPNRANGPSKPSAHSANQAPSTNSVNFEAVDLYVPEQCWRDNEYTYDDEDLGDGNFARSYSLTSDKRRNREDFKSRSLMNLQSDRSHTLPNPRRRQRPSLDDSAVARSISNRSSHSSVTSQEGYLEHMFRKECEVDERMSGGIEEESESDGEGNRRQAKPFNVFGTSSESGSSTETETDSETEQEEITLPKVRLKENAVMNGQRDKLSLEETIKKMNDLESDVRDSEYHSAESQAENDEVFKTPADNGEYTTELDRVIAREASRHNTDTLNSQGSSDEGSSSHNSSSSQLYEGKTAKERALERGSADSLPERRKISPQQDFSFTGTSQVSTDDTPGSAHKKRGKIYAKGGRRYTVQGLETSHKHKSAPDIRNQRPVYTRDDSIPEDLIAVYNNMNREELIQLVVTHKAQLIRKDQYIKDLEKYIDSLLVRVMEASPRLLQNL